MMGDSSSKAAKLGGIGVRTTDRNPISNGFGLDSRGSPCPQDQSIKPDAPILARKGYVQSLRVVRIHWPRKQTSFVRKSIMLFIFLKMGSFLMRCGQ